MRTPPVGREWDETPSPITPPACGHRAGWHRRRAGAEPPAVGEPVGTKSGNGGGGREVQAHANTLPSASGASMQGARGIKVSRTLKDTPTLIGSTQRRCCGRSSHRDTGSCRSSDRSTHECCGWPGKPRHQAPGTCWSRRSWRRPAARRSQDPWE